MNEAETVSCSKRNQGAGEMEKIEFTSMESHKKYIQAASCLAAVPNPGLKSQKPCGCPALQPQPGPA